MSRRRPPRALGQRFAEGDRAQRVGAAGLLYNAAPLPAHASAVAEALGSLASGTEEAHKIDLFTLAESGAQDLTLTYLPSTESWNLSLNGVTARWGTDYTVSGQTMSLLTPLDARTGDVVEVQYDYLTGVPATPVMSFPEARGASFDSGNVSGFTLPLPSGTVAGDRALCWSFNGFNGGTVPSGWTALFNSDDLAGQWGRSLLITKTLDAADITAGSVTVTFSAGFDSYAALLTFEPCSVTSSDGIGYGSGSVPATLSRPLTLTASGYGVYFGHRRPTATVAPSRGTLQDTRTLPGMRGATYMETGTAFSGSLTMAAATLDDGASLCFAVLAL